MDPKAATQKIIDDALTDFKRELLALSDEKSEIIKQFSQDIIDQKISKLRDELLTNI